MSAWWARLEERLWSPTPGTRGILWDVVQRWTQILERSLTGFFKSRGAANASALTYTTLLTLVPLLAIVIPTLKAFGVYENAHQAIMRIVDGTLPSDPIAKSSKDHNDLTGHKLVNELATTATLMSSLAQQVRTAAPDNSLLHLRYIYLPAPGRAEDQGDLPARLKAASQALAGGVNITSVSQQLGARARVSHPLTVQADNPNFDRNLFNYLTDLGPNRSSEPIAGRNGWLIFQILERSDPLRASLHDFVDKIFTIVNNTNLKNLGYLGLAGLLFAVMSLLSKIERSMNDAWAIHRSRAWGHKVFDYMNLIVIFVLMLMALSATTTGSIIQFQGAWEKLGFNYVQTVLLKVLPFIIIWLAFITLYKYMPNTNVRWGSAVAGGLIAGSLFQGIQISILKMHLLVERYNKIYGVFAVLVIVIVLIYISWCVVLWGMWVCSVHQNLRDWRRKRRKWRNTPEERETLALRLAVLLAKPLLELEHPRRLDLGELADELCLPPLPVDEMIELFRQHELAVQTSEDERWLLARAPEKLTALEVLRLVRYGGMKRTDDIENPLLEGCEPQVREPLARWTIKEMAELPLDQVRTIQL